MLFVYVHLIVHRFFVNCYIDLADIPQHKLRFPLHQTSPLSNVWVTDLADETDFVSSFYCLET